MKDLQAELEKFNTYKANIDSKMKFVEIFKKNNVNSVEEFEAAVRKGAQEISSKQNDLKKKMEELSSSLSTRMARE